MVGGNDHSLVLRGADPFLQQSSSPPTRLGTDPHFHLRSLFAEPQSAGLGIDRRGRVANGPFVVDKNLMFGVAWCRLESFGVV